MTPNERLVKYMERKAEIIGLAKLFTDEDRAELLEWEIAEEVLRYIGFLSTDPWACPWCIKVKEMFFWPGNNCETCGWGYRHGLCSLSVGDYQKALASLGLAGKFKGLVDKLVPHADELDKILGRTNE
jgi:hypothetical protein